MDSLKPLKKHNLYNFGEFQIDAEEQRLWHGEELIPLTPKEFEVLFYLVEHAGEVAEKNDLLDAIWNDTYVEEATLARNISWLRKKLRKASKGKKIIETISKRGYRLNAEITYESNKNQIIIDEQTVQKITSEETFTFSDYSLPSSNYGANKTPALENTNGFSILGIFSSLKTLFLIIGLTTFIGVCFFSYQIYSSYNSSNKIFISSISSSPLLVNLALGKATNQSSNFEKNRGFSYEAVDGNTNGNWFQASTTSTGDDKMDSVIVRGTTDPWWEVDLGKVYDIEQIKIYNRTDLNSHYLRNFKVDIRNDPNEKFTPFVDGIHNYEDRRINPITLKKKANARYVRIQVIGSSKFLSLAEVEVMGIPKPGEVSDIPKTCQPKETQITVFTEQLYQGECFILDLRNYPTSESMGFANKNIYSLLVGEDIKAKVCPEVDFLGKCEEVIARRSFEEPMKSVKMADYFQLKIENKCLEVDLYNTTKMSVKMNKCSDYNNQKWFWTEWGQLRVNTDKCLDLSGDDQVIVTPCQRKSLSNDRLQRWVWTNLNEIRTATRNKTCLEVINSKTENDLSVQIKECNFAENQIWKFVK